MIGRALAAGVRAAWVTGDSAYGADSRLRRDLEARRMSYVLGVACDHRVITADAGMRRADSLAAALPPAAWQRHSAGPGAKGHRWYDWARIGVPGGAPGRRWLLIRRSRRTGEPDSHENNEVRLERYCPDTRDALAVRPRADCDWLDSSSYVQTTGTSGAVSSKRSPGRYHSTV